MQRSIGVTLSAVTSILGSVLLLICVVLISVTALFAPGDPALTTQVRLLALAGGGAMFLFSAWGIATAIGLLRLAAWARWSILSFSALLAFIGAMAAISILFVPVPQMPGLPPGFARATLAGMSCFYFTFALIGGFWLYFFNRRTVKAQFASGGLSHPPGGRPFSITLIAWLLFAGAAICAVFALLPFPVTLFSWLLRGWSARLVYASIVVIDICLGWGLLRLRPLSRVLSIGFFVFGALNNVAFMLLPGADGRLATMMAVLYPALSPQIFNIRPHMLASATMGSIFAIVPVWFLVRTRRAFIPASAVDSPALAADHPPDSQPLDPPPQL